MTGQLVDSGSCSGFICWRINFHLNSLLCATEPLYEACLTEFRMYHDIKGGGLYAERKGLLLSRPSLNPKACKVY